MSIIACTGSSLTDNPHVLVARPDMKALIPWHALPGRHALAGSISGQATQCSLGRPSLWSDPLADPSMHLCVLRHLSCGICPHISPEAFGVWPAASVPISILRRPSQSHLASSRHWPMGAHHEFQSAQKIRHSGVGNLLTSLPPPKIKCVPAATPITSLRLLGS